METLFAYHQNLIKNTHHQFYRYLYPKINWNQRLIAIKGARGTGKTTLLLQFIKNQKSDVASILYVTTEHPWFYTHSLFELAENFVKYGGQTLIIDEIHKYPNWSREIKTIYDGFPQLQIIFSASSALDIYKGEADLSRRVITYKLNGLSFREYLAIQGHHQIDAISLEEIFKNHTSIASEITSKLIILPLFKKYLELGYYPFGLKDIQGDYFQKINQTINAVLETDLAAIEGYQAGSVIKLKRLLGVIAESAPFQPNIAGISRKMDISRDYIYAFISHLVNARLVNVAIKKSKGISKLQKPDKLYLENTNLSYALKNSPDIGNIRETFFLNQIINSDKEIQLPDAGDFIVDNKFIVEIGGKSKKSKQIESLENAFVVQDEIEIGWGNKIPLWLFGFIY